MSAKKIIGELSPDEIVSAYVVPETLSAEQKKSADLELAEVRSKRRAAMSESQRMYNDLILLNTRLEDYVSSTGYRPDFNFGSFLQEYLQLIKKKQKEFAQEVNMNSTVINQYIHSHRNPNDNFMIRLEIHSGNMIRAVDLLKLIEKEKEHQISNDMNLRIREGKHVSKRISFSH